MARKSQAHGGYYTTYLQEKLFIGANILLITRKIIHYYIIIYRCEKLEIFLNPGLN